MNLKLVTWEGDLTQFLVEAETNDEAIRKAVEANKSIMEVNDEIYECISECASYTVEDVTFDILEGLFNRTDCGGRYKNSIVFWD